MRERRRGPAGRRGAVTVAAALLVAACSGGGPDHPSAADPGGTPVPSPVPSGAAGGVPGGGATPPRQGHPAASWGPSSADLARAGRVAARMSDRELVGQLFAVSYAGVEPPIDELRRFHLGGIVVGGDNPSGPRALARSNARAQHARAAPWPLVVAVDQEGGAVARVGAAMTPFPTYMALGAADRPGLAAAAAAASGRELRAAGFTMVLAPDADVTAGPADPTIRSRSAGADPALVARTVAGSVRGYLRSGIVPVVKHFPGHGSVTADSHRRLPRQPAGLAALAARDFRPFARAIAVGAPAVMVGHIALNRIDPGVPADLSRRATGLLTRRLGFAGLVVTDALDMRAVTRSRDPGEAAVAALRAGSDLLLMPASLPRAYRGVLAALRDGRLTRARLEGSVATIGALMWREQRHPRPPMRVIGTHGAVSRRVSEAAVTVVSGHCRGPYLAGAAHAVGERWLVDLFDAAAARAGLATGRGPVVALVGTTAPRRRSDIAVGVSTPYALADARGAPTRLAAFGWTPQAMDAVVDVLTGAATPRGRLPVPVRGVPGARCVRA